MSSDDAIKTVAVHHQKRDVQTWAVTIQKSCADVAEKCPEAICHAFCGEAGGLKAALVPVVRLSVRKS